MHRSTARLISLLTLATALVVLAPAPALAHRPYFEEQDISPEAPWRIDDPTISTAIYATLDSTTDVDYFRFEGQAGQVVLVSLTIPQIEGQDDFAPTMALIGPGLPDGDLPSLIVRPESTGALRFEPSPGPAPTFFEPFSHTSYWERQEERVPLPADGEYTVAVWHSAGQLGRYVFVVGDKELPGGDLTFPIKMRSYWTPVGTSASWIMVWWPALLAVSLVLLVTIAIVLVFTIRRRKRKRHRPTAHS